jgi:hypothetical protein
VDHHGQPRVGIKEALNAGSRHPPTVVGDAQGEEDGRGLEVDGDPAAPGVARGVHQQVVDDAAQRSTRFVANVADLAKTILPELKGGDLVLSLGAGNIVQARTALNILFGNS